MGLSGPKALSSSSGYASALVFAYRSGQPFLSIMLRWTHLAAAVALGHACNYPFLRNNSYGCARDPCAALDAVACAAEATCDMSSVGCATACAALNSSQCMYLPANYTLYLITYNMDDITYGPLKCSQEMVVNDDYSSYWYECSGNGTAGGGAPGLDDDGVSSSPGLDDDAAVDPMTAAMAPSDPSTYALVVGFVLGLVVAAATRHREVLHRRARLLLRVQGPGEGALDGGGD